MRELREIPFFNLYPLKCKNNVILYSDAESDMRSALPQNPLINHFLNASLPKYVAGVSGCGCLWLGSRDGKLKRLEIESHTIPLIENPKEIYSHDFLQPFSLSHHETLIKKYQLKEVSHESSTLEISNVEDYQIFDLRLTQLFISHTIYTPLQKSQIIHTNEMNGQDSSIPSSPSLVPTEVLMAIGSHTENEWIVKVFLIDAHGGFVDKAATTYKTENKNKKIQDSLSATLDPPKPCREFLLMDCQNRGRGLGKTTTIAVVAGDLNRKGTKFVVGLSNGCLVYYPVDFRNPKNPVRGKKIVLSDILQRNDFPPISNKSCKPSSETALDSVEEGVTNLIFGYSISLKQEVLFVTTTHSVSCFIVPDDLKSNTTVLFMDNLRGCCSQCCCLLKSPHNNVDDRLCVLRHECMFIYSPDQGNLSALPFCTTQFCCGFKSYVLALHQDRLRNPQENDFPEEWSLSSSVPRLPPTQRQMFSPVYVTAMVHSPTLRFLCYSSRIEGIVNILPYNDSSVVIISETPALEFYELQEKSFFSQIQTLVERKMFDWAVEMAGYYGAPEQYIAVIHVLHGHWLFEKKCYSEAAQIYCKAIPYIESSGLISQFLKYQQFSSLIVYLKALYANGYFTENHLALLFNCFCISDNQDDFLAFLNDSKNHAIYHKLDWLPAVTECRVFGNINFAKEVALHANLTKSLLFILIDDFHKIDEALSVLEKLPPDQAASLLLEPTLLRSLLDTCLDRTTELLQKLINKKKILISFLIDMFIKVELENLPADGLDGISSQFSLQTEENLLELPNGTDTSLLPKGMFLRPSRYLDIQFLNIVFNGLKRVIEDGEDAPPVEYSCLVVTLELLLYYATKNTQLSGGMNDFVLHKKDDILKWPIESLICNHFKSLDSLLHAFFLTRLYGCSRGLLLVCERIASLCSSLRSNEKIPLWCYGALQTPLLVDMDNPDQLVNYCSRYGVKDTTFWKLAIKKCSADPSNGIVKKLLKRLAVRLNQDHITSYISPLTLIRLLCCEKKSQILSFSTNSNNIVNKESSVVFGDVKAYLIELVLSIKSSTNSLKEKTDAEFSTLRRERLQLRNLKKNLYYFSLEGQICSRCQTSLEFPVIQFLCGHAYHEHCIPSQKHLAKCFLCAPDHELKMNFIKDNLAALRSDSFQNLLKCTKAPIVSYVAKFLGYGLLTEMQSLLNS